MTGDALGRAKPTQHNSWPRHFCTFATGPFFAGTGKSTRPVLGSSRFWKSHTMEAFSVWKHCFLGADRGRSLCFFVLRLFWARRSDYLPFFTPSLAVGPYSPKKTDYTGPAPSSGLVNISLKNERKLFWGKYSVYYRHVLTKICMMIISGFAIPEKRRITVTHSNKKNLNLFFIFLPCLYKTKILWLIRQLYSKWKPCVRKISLTLKIWYVIILILYK